VTIGAEAVSVETSYITVPADEVTTEVCVAVRVSELDLCFAYATVLP